MREVLAKVRKNTQCQEMGCAPCKSNASRMTKHPFKAHLYNKRVPNPKIDQPAARARATRSHHMPDCRNDTALATTGASCTGSVQKQTDN
jgi:hypothetical protein